MQLECTVLELKIENDIFSYNYLEFREAQKGHVLIFENDLKSFVMKPEKM